MCLPPALSSVGTASHLVVSGIPPHSCKSTNVADHVQAMEKAMESQWKRIALALAMFGVSMVMVVLVRQGS